MTNEELSLGRDLDEMAMGTNKKSLGEQVSDLVKRFFSKNSKNTSTVDGESSPTQEPLQP